MILSDKEIKLLERIADHIEREELDYLLNPLNHAEAVRFLCRLGKALGIDTRPTVPLYFYEPSNLDRDQPDTVLIQVWIHYPTTGYNQPHTVEARPRRKVIKMFKAGKLDTDTYKELIKKLRG